MPYVSKGVPQQAEVAQGVPGRLRSHILLTFRWSVVSQMHRPPLTQEKSLVLTFRGWVDLRAHGSVGGTMEKIPSDTTGNQPQDHTTSSTAP